MLHPARTYRVSPTEALVSTRNNVFVLLVENKSVAAKLSSDNILKVRTGIDGTATTVKGVVNGLPA